MLNEVWRTPQLWSDGAHGEAEIVVYGVITQASVAAAVMARWANPADRAAVRPGPRAADSLLARAGLRALLARHTGAEWGIRHAPSGKPFVVAQDGTPGPAVSLSHSGGVVAVAMAFGGDVGIDIERHRARDFAALAAHAFGPAEQLQIAATGADGFYRIWTLREALAKATGEGLALATNGQDLVGGNFANGGCVEHAGQSWRLAGHPYPAGYSLAVAASAVGYDGPPRLTEL